MNPGSLASELGKVWLKGKNKRNKNKNRSPVLQRIHEYDTKNMLSFIKRKKLISGMSWKCQTFDFQNTHKNEKSSYKLGENICKCHI